MNVPAQGWGGTVQQCRCLHCGEMYASNYIHTCDNPKPVAARCFKGFDRECEHPFGCMVGVCVGEALAICAKSDASTGERQP